MKIILQKVANTRDLGGIKTKYGKIKFNKLLRSGHLCLATESDCKILTEKHHLCRIVDLRTSLEISNNPDVTIEGVEWLNIPILSAVTFGITYEKLDGKTIAKMIDDGIARMIARGETPSEHMRTLYKGFVENEFSNRGYGQFLKLLANEPVSGATLWHCSAGKDRVGTCTALLLHCLGVSREEIVRDYMLTNEMNESHAASILNTVRPYVSDEIYEMEKRRIFVEESFLTTFFEEIEKRFGSVDDFLAHCGVSEQDVAKLRENYIE